MIILLHGENTTASRNRLRELRQAQKGDIVLLEAKSLAPEELRQNLEANSLLSESRTIIIENIVGNKSLVDLLTPPSDNVTLILWEGKEVSPTNLKILQAQLPHLKIEEFKTAKSTFKLLESLSPGNQASFLPLAKKYLDEEVPEVVLTMLARQFRLLLLTQNPKGAGPEDWKKLAPWQKDRLFQQAKKFPKGSLEKLLTELLTIDYQNKTSQSPSTLKENLELFFLKI